MRRRVLKVKKKKGALSWTGATLYGYSAVSIARELHAGELPLSRPALIYALNTRSASRGSLHCLRVMAIMPSGFKCSKYSLQASTVYKLFSLSATAPAAVEAQVYTSVISITSYLSLLLRIKD